uniref:Myb-like domain-containing protein n=1 Tax=Brassica oleracea var. oleracea TaxID=109376 RepID=A0A0D3DVX0_BRAOL
MAIFLLSGGSSQRDGVCVGGSCRRWKTVSCLSVALVGVEKRRDLSVMVAVREEGKQLLLLRRRIRSFCLEMSEENEMDRRRRNMIQVASKMDSYPFSQSSKFVELLNSQQSIFFGNNDDSVSLSSSQSPSVGNFGTEDGGETGTQRRERRKWTPKDDIVLISSWLNTSKDPVVSNEQRSDAFWTRVMAYFAASRQDGGCDQRESRHCKQRWHRINDLVCKFAGAYAAASREKTSGQNENDVLKQAHQIFYTNHKQKFLLEHAWKELRNDQKWCEQASAKTEGSTLNDINVLDRSPVFDDIIYGRAPQVNFSVNGIEYHLAYYLTDGIYPKWATFIQSIPIPQGPKAVLFAQRQEAVRKDVERAFGVLQARFAIVKNPALSWDKVKIGKIMRACIILHNMIVENERDEYSQYDVSDFQQGEGSRSSHVDLNYSTNIANQMGVRTRIRDR